MTQRLTDYGIVLGVVLVLMSLFKLSRYLLHRFIKLIEKKNGEFSSDSALLWGMRFLLTGLLMLPFITALLAFADNQHLKGGMPLHLALTAISVVLFSFAEDLFRVYNGYGSKNPESVSWHFRKLIIPLVGFWLVGCVFISPLFYSALTVLAIVFYRLCLYFRKPSGTTGKNA